MREKLARAVVGALPRGSVVPRQEADMVVDALLDAMMEPSRVAQDAGSDEWYSIVAVARIKGPYSRRVWRAMLKAIKDE